MNNQKDIEKTSSKTYGEQNVPNVKSLVDIDIYEFANKKTEKLVTALYLVSDCMDTDDALKGKIRLLGVNLLSDIYKLSTISTLEKHNYISISLARVNELLSFIEIAFNIGFISEMNTNILKKEFFLLISDLKANLDKDKHFTFSLNEKMFDLPETQNTKQPVSFMDGSFIKDKYKGQIYERTLSNSVSFINGKSPLDMYKSKKTVFRLTNLAGKEDRINKIISIIKDKKNLPNNADGVSIKDISLSFNDCSEKTIQRELNSLVDKGKLKKTGSKRWSRYKISE